MARAEEQAVLLGGAVVLAVIVAMAAPRSLPPGIQIREDFAALSVALHAYRAANGAYPRGNNFVMMQAITGQRDPGRAQVFWHPPARRLNSKGELLDPWGRAYEFGIVEIDGDVRIRSAGPDMEFNTADDLRLDVTPTASGSPPPSSP
jgi:hypothetical protein